MRIIGVTGGVGCGKSTILQYMEEKYSAFVVQADLVAHEVMLPGQECHKKLVELLGPVVLNEDLSFNRSVLASRIFSDPAIRQEINGIVHPQVRMEIERRLEREKQLNRKLAIVEAALLLEAGYDDMCDEIWYVYASEETRIARLMESRGYSEEKARGIISSQLGEEQFRKSCTREINNDGSREFTVHQIDVIMHSETM